MATRSPERRQHSDRRRTDRASDLYQRLEEKRKQIERRRTVRREADRRADKEASPPEPPTDDGDRSEPAVTGERAPHAK